VPNPALAQALARWAAAGDDPWRSLNSVSTTVTSATLKDGRRLRVIHQWSWQPVSIELPEATRDALSGEALPAGHRLELSAWDVRVLVQ